MVLLFAISWPKLLVLQLFLHVLLPMVTRTAMAPAKLRPIAQTAMKAAMDLAKLHPIAQIAVA